MLWCNWCNMFETACFVHYNLQARSVRLIYCSWKNRSARSKIATLNTCWADRAAMPDSLCVTAVCLLGKVYMSACLCAPSAQLLCFMQAELCKRHVGHFSFFRNASLCSESFGSIIAISSVPCATLGQHSLSMRLKDGYHLHPLV